jgi:hypothetical protein
MNLSEKDLEQIKDHGLNTDTIESQIGSFKSGFPYARLDRPAVINDGIRKIEQAEIDELIGIYNEQVKSLELLKFVPASGAATRMFKSLFAFKSTYEGSESDYSKLISNQDPGSMFDFFKRLEKFAFYNSLKVSFEKKDKSLAEQHVKRAFGSILDELLDSSGLSYGSLPKALLEFHTYGDQTRTAAEEHLVEGCEYAKNSEGEVNIHFTVSPEHLKLFKAHINTVKNQYERQYDSIINVSFSTQKPSTDTLAVDLNNEPFRNPDDSLLFRPAGHGALLENLNEINADIVFLKNIDNVVPDRLKPDTILYKKLLSAILVLTQKQVFELIKQLEAGSVNLQEAQDFIYKTLGFDAGKHLDKEELIAILNRPIRVCGMVKNEGEPGGGPFWVRMSDGRTSLQIVESAQINLEAHDQNEVFKNATHFNPVDVVCSLKDHKGEKFDLLKYRDPATGFISQKSKDGKDLRALELPGLWNGSMAFWNTIFVEVPLSTFNPVKTVHDLLKDEHQ